MANNWFQFKKFIIYQQLSAMKVSTDACLFGAWVARNLPATMECILDVGTGTGLLSLMLLQEHEKVRLVALEPESAAASEAEENIKRTDWKDRGTVIAESLQKFSAENKAAKFDFIICNPPFFQNHLLGSERNRNAARHDSLLPGTLAKESFLLTKTDGQLAVIYPENVWESWLIAARKEGWFPEQVLYVQPVPQKTPNRICGIFGKQKKHCIIEEQLQIRERNGAYSQEFNALLAPFYLNS